MVKKTSTQAETADDEQRGPGQPAHEPTAESRAKVEALAQYGVKHKSIAAEMGMALLTLRRHYMAELMKGDARVQTLVGQTALRVALGGPAEYYPNTHPDAALRGKLKLAERAPSERLLEFFLKTRLGLVPHIGVDLDPFGKPEDVEFNTAGMTNKERVERLAGLFDKVADRMKAVAKKAPPEKPAATSTGSKAVN